MSIPKGFVEVLFCCNLCGLDKKPALVRARRRDEDITRWVEVVVGSAVSQAHGLASLMCEAKTYDLMLPTFDGMEWIGQERPEGAKDLSEEDRRAIGEILKRPPENER